MKDYFTVNELADHFRVNPKTVYRLAERGEIPGCQMDGEWRFLKKEVLKALYREVDPQSKEEKEMRSRRTIEKLRILGLRNRFQQSVDYCLKRNMRGGHWEKVVGYDLDTLKRRLKSTIPKGCTWEDFINGWLQIDHIIPGCAFNIEDRDSFDFWRSWELKNLRLLPKEENLKKGSKLLQQFQPGLNLKGGVNERDHRTIL
jgi:excisionase family DNA binding protein